VPVDVAVEEPWAWVIGDESDRYIVGLGGPSVDDVAAGLDERKKKIYE
jgi:hypothetical protein